MRKQYPWWLSSGTDPCHVCAHLYISEVGLRCVACDRGLCVDCVIIEQETREPWCPGCYANEREA
ncbi:MAG: hypothetical protein ACRELT_08065 [Longimicrobiales bacterium]